MLMSDAPNHHPQQLPDRLNEPCLLPYLCQTLARAYRTKAEVLAQRTYQTALSFFKCVPGVGFFLTNPGPCWI